MTHNFHVFHASREFLHFFVVVAVDLHNFVTHNFFVVNLYNFFFFFFFFFASWYGRQHFFFGMIVQHGCCAKLGSGVNQVLAVGCLDVNGALSVQLKQSLDRAATNSLIGRFNHNNAADQLDWHWFLVLDLVLDLDGLLDLDLVLDLPHLQVVTRMVDATALDFIAEGGFVVGFVVVVEGVHRS